MPRAEGEETCRVRSNAGVLSELTKHLQLRTPLEIACFARSYYIVLLYTLAAHRRRRLAAGSTVYILDVAQVFLTVLFAVAVREFQGEHSASISALRQVEMSCWHGSTKGSERDALCFGRRLTGLMLIRGC